MILTTYVVVLVTSIVAGAIAVALWRQKETPVAKVFVTGALLNALSLIAFIWLRRRREK